MTSNDSSRSFAAGSQVGLIIAPNSLPASIARTWLAGGFNHRAELASGFYRAHVFFVALQAHHRPAPDLGVAAHDAHLGPLCQLALIDAAAEYDLALLRAEDF